MMEGTFSRDMIDTNAVEFENSYAEMTMLRDAAFAETAWGDCLTLRAEEFGIQRKQAVKANGQVTVTGQSGAYIIRGSLFQTKDGLRFYTTESATIPSDGTEADIDVQAADTGVKGNVAPGTITEIPYFFPNVYSVTNYMLAQLECPGALITNYYETERGFVFSGRWYGGGLPKVEKKTGRVGWYLEEWGNRDKAKWKATEDLFMGSFEASLGPIYDSIKEKQEIVRKKQLPGVHNPYPESNNGMTAAEALKIAENSVGTKFHKYAESEDSFAFSIFRPGEVVYGPKSYIVSKSTGEVKQDPHKFFDPWPFGEWHAVTDDLRGKKNFIRRFLDKLKGSRP